MNPPRLTVARRSTCSWPWPRTVGDIFDELRDIRPLHPKNDTFPGEVFLAWVPTLLRREVSAGTSRSPKKAGRPLPSRWRAPERRYHKLRYAIMAVGATAGGVQIDLLDEVAYWSTDNFWSYATLAAVPWIGAGADQRSIPLGVLCERLHPALDEDGIRPVAAMLVIHATKKLRDPLKTAPPHGAEVSTTGLGLTLFFSPQPPCLSTTDVPTRPRAPRPEGDPRRPVRCGARRGAARH